MDPWRKKLSAPTFLLLLLLLLVAAEMAAPGVEAKECLVPSVSFHGLCFKSGRCAAVCRGEGFADGGRCGGIFLACFYRKPCDAAAR